MNGICEKLKELRKQNGLSVQDVLDKLQDYGITVGDKAFYHWEAGRRQPDADTFFALCQIYGVDSFDVFKDTKKSPAPEGAEEKMSDEDMKLSADLRAVLAKHGVLSADGDITDEQADIIFHAICLMRAALKETV